MPTPPVDPNFASGDRSPILDLTGKAFALGKGFGLDEADGARV